MPIERREFLKTTGKAITASAAALALGGKILGANDRVRVAICGTRGRGTDHIKGFSRVPGVELAVLCDVDENILNQRLTDVENLGRPKPKSYVDIRKLLEDKDIDAVSIATPNHWHSLMAIWACQAGKDVYVEKPCSHNTFEGRQLVSEHDLAAAAAEKPAGEEAPLDDAEYAQYIDPKYAEQLMSESPGLDEDLPSISRKGPVAEAADELATRNL